MLFAKRLVFLGEERLTLQSGGAHLWVKKKDHIESPRWETSEISTAKNLLYLRCTQSRCHATGSPAPPGTGLPPRWETRSRGSPCQTICRSLRQTTHTVVSSRKIKLAFSDIFLSNIGQHLTLFGVNFRTATMIRNI